MFILFAKIQSRLLIGGKGSKIMPGLIGIGVGPGDVELLTVKAVKAIQNADIIMCPASKETRPSIASVSYTHLTLPTKA